MRLKFNYDDIFDVSKKFESHGYKSFSSDFLDAISNFGDDNIDYESFEIEVDLNKPQDWIITDFREKE